MKSLMCTTGRPREPAVAHWVGESSERVRISLALREAKRPCLGDIIVREFLPDVPPWGISLNSTRENAATHGHSVS